MCAVKRRQSLDLRVLRDPNPAWSRFLFCRKSRQPICFVLEFCNFLPFLQLVFSKLSSVRQMKNVVSIDTMCLFTFLHVLSQFIAVGNDDREKLKVKEKRKTVKVLKGSESKSS